MRPCSTRFGPLFQQPNVRLPWGKLQDADRLLVETLEGELGYQRRDSRRAADAPLSPAARFEWQKLPVLISGIAFRWTGIIDALIE